MRTMKRRVLSRMRDRVLVCSALVSGAWVTACQLVAGYGDALDDGRPAGASRDGSSGDATTGDQSTPPPADSGDDEATTDGGSDRLDGECLIGTASAFKCETAYIVRFQGQQTIDGLPEEFCNLTPIIFHAATMGAAVTGTSDSTDAVVSLRLAWSDTGLHLHANVAESLVLSELPDGQPYQGDALEIMLTGSLPDGGGGLTGNYPDPDPGFRFVIGAPEPNGDVPCQVSTSSGANPLTCEDLPYLSATSVNVDGGFDVEAMINWPPESDGGSLLTTRNIRFDVSFDRRGLDGGRAFQSSFYFEDAGPTATRCAADAYAPYCDDRSWCLTTLEGL
jgi:hypothetical protein